jgi:acetyl esterase/lipase
LLFELTFDVMALQVIPLDAEGLAAITAYLPATGKATGTAVLVIPGGGYGFLATDTEGTPIAKAFKEKGVAAFVLKYRLPGQKSGIPVQDAEQAMKLIRTRAAEFGIDVAKVGVIGFSAGGHLAATLANRSSRDVAPNFSVLVYPVISMKRELTHAGSRMNLLGNAPTDSLVKAYSAEEQVTVNTPPTYITHTADDDVVSVQNSIVMYQALVKNYVDAELHLFPRGNHGFIQRLPVSEWLEPVLLFMKKQGF